MFLFIQSSHVFITLFIVGYFDAKEDGYIFIDENQHINFTEKGKAKAMDIYDRHQLLTQFIIKITGLDEEQAEQNACRVEHVIDSDVVRGIKDWMNRNK